MEYIWFEYDKPIKSQLPEPFKAVAIILSSFISMPLNWTKSNRKYEYEHIFPTLDQIKQCGKPVTWQEIMKKSKFKDYSELALGLVTSIATLKEEYRNQFLADKINLNEDEYYPIEDNLSIFLIKDFVDVLTSKGAKKISFSNTILDVNKTLEVNEANCIEICKLCEEYPEVMIYDNNLDFAFLSVYDSFINLFLAKEESDIIDVLNIKKWEGFICDNNTRIRWFL